LMKTAMRQLQLTARAYHRVLKLSRTIADLAGSEGITQVHLADHGARENPCQHKHPDSAI